MKSKQVNIRPNAETMAQLDRVRRWASAALGLDLSLTDIFRLGLNELERKYAPAAEATPAPKEKRRK